MSLGLTLNDSHARGDAYLLPSIQMVMPESAAHDDNGLFTVGPLYALARSGSPDADDWGDAWTDSTIGNTGVNHGNADPLTVGNTAVVEQRAFMEFNLTRFTGLTGYGNSHTFQFRANSASALLASTLNVAFGANASRPFVESTITQSNQPATPTLFTRSFSVAVDATFPLYTVTMTDAEINQLLGKWALVVFTVAALDAGSLILSRENSAAAPSRPNFNFKGQTG